MKSIFSIILVISINYFTLGQSVVRLNSSVTDSIFISLDNKAFNEVDYKIIIHPNKNGKVSIDYYEKVTTYEVKAGLKKADSIMGVNLIQDLQSGLSQKKLKKKYHNYLNSSLVAPTFKYVNVKSAEVRNIDVILFKPPASLKIRDMKENTIEVKSNSISEIFSYYEKVDISFVEFLNNAIDK